MRHHLREHKWKFRLIIAGAILIFLWLIKAALMSTYISSKIHIPIYVGDISLWPSETSIRTFEIVNPRGYGRQNAFHAKHVKIRYRFGDLFHAVPELEEIALKDVHLNIEILERTPQSSNWAAIGARMPLKKIQKQFIIHRLTIENMTAEITGKGAVMLGVAGTQHFDQIEFDHVSGQEGFPTKELVGKIFESAGVEKYLEQFLNPTERIQNSINPFDLF